MFFIYQLESLQNNSDKLIGQRRFNTMLLMESVNKSQKPFTSVIDYIFGLVYHFSLIAPHKLPQSLDQRVHFFFTIFVSHILILMSINDLVNHFNEKICHERYLSFEQTRHSGGLSIFCGLVGTENQFVKKTISLAVCISFRMLSCQQSENCGQEVVKMLLLQRTPVEE